MSYQLFDKRTKTMSKALQHFKETRPEEYKEYRGYLSKYRRLTYGFYIACAVAFGLLVLFALKNPILGLVVFLAEALTLRWLYIHFSQERSTLRLSIALMEMTFDDPNAIPADIQAELRDKLSQED